MKDLCDEVGFVYYLIIARLYDLDPKLNKNERTITALHTCLHFYVNVCFSFLASFLLLPKVFVNKLLYYLSYMFWFLLLDISVDKTTVINHSYYVLSYFVCKIQLNQVESVGLKLHTSTVFRVCFVSDLVWARNEVVNMWYRLTVNTTISLAMYAISAKVPLYFIFYQLQTRDGLKMGRNLANAEVPEFGRRIRANVWLGSVTSF